MSPEKHALERAVRTTDHGSYISFTTSRGELLVSKRDWPKVKDYTWLCNHNKIGSPIPYAKVPDGSGSRKIIYPHWLIYGPDQDFYFLNRNPLDIRRENVVCGNFPIKVRTYSKKEGYFPHVMEVAENRYLAQIRVPGGKQKYIGVFQSEKDAAEEVIHQIKLIYPKEARQTIATMKKLFAYDAPEKAKKWGYA